MAVGSQAAAALHKHVYSIGQLFANWAVANNASYTLWWGSLLGAMREGEMFPNDDDIDILMAKKDFEKLKRLKHSAKVGVGGSFVGGYLMMHGRFFCMTLMGSDWIQLFPVVLDKNNTPASCVAAGVDIWSDQQAEAKMMNWTDHFFDLGQDGGNLVRRRLGPLTNLLSVPDGVAVRYLCETYGCDSQKKNAYRDSIAEKFVQVSCGQHTSSDGCKGCTAGHDNPSGWCHGECQWHQSSNQCVLKRLLTDCGNDYVSTTGCDACVHPKLGANRTMSRYNHVDWCGGDCAYAKAADECVPSPLSVSCGGHQSATGCEGCTAGHDNPSDWCHGDCTWHKIPGKTDKHHCLPNELTKKWEKQVRMCECIPYDRTCTCVESN